MVQFNSAGIRGAVVEKAQVAGYDVPADLYPYLGLGSVAGEAAKEGGAAGGAGCDATFRYAGSLEKNAPLATFDIRDEVCLEVGGFKHGQVVRDASGGELIVIGVKAVDGTARLWFQPRDLGRPGAGAFPEATAEVLRARFSLVTGGGATRQLRPIAPEDFEVVEDADGERLCLCRHCRLPLGDFEFDGASLAHGECLAELTLCGLRAETEAREKEAAAAKKARRAEYEIGWKVEHIPRSMKLMQELAGSAQSGLYCLVLDGEGAARVAPTTEPAAAVNLEYLALALQVRLLEGREPFFSLDPVDPANRGSMQEKRFEPAWLAGTSAGEVLFQADYHLKELSMGEYQQPVIGMQSCFDISEEEGEFKAWNAREWFVVNKAGVNVSADGALIPSLKMGVEAREQILGPNGMEDIKVTKPDHPLVKYADAFTDRFDLIAERKSVIHKLRELAKASVLAKFLLDAEVQLEDTWFEFEASDSSACCLEVPQLWNERYSAQLQVQDGKVVDSGDVGCKSVRGVYGGVEFGIDKFDLSQPTQNWRLRSVVAPSAATTGLRLPAPRSVAAPVLETALARAARVVPTARGVPEAAIAVPRFSKRIKGVGAARGVDLNLDQFDLSSPDQVDSEVVGASDPLALGDAFWASLDGEGEGAFAAEDKAFLKQIFHPSLSDRRDEGELFVPLDTTPSYIEALRDLVDAEGKAMNSRKEHFLSMSFSAAEPGPLFPSSWSSLEGKTSQSTKMQPRADYKAAAPVFEQVMKTAMPVFDKTTEDGERFRIYQFGGVEVRTTQEAGGKEVIGQVFAARSDTGPVAEGDFVVKATEYVEREAEAFRSYVVLETASGRRVLTEKRADGSVAWEVEPEGLQARNSVAKIVRSTDCSAAAVSLSAFKNYRVLQASAEASAAERKQYAQGAFSLASGVERSGFRQPAKSGKWQLSMEGQGGWRGAGAQRCANQAIRVRCGK